MAKLGAIEERFVGDVRPATVEEPLDPSWRLISPSDPFEAPDDSAPWPEDATTLYYWRPTFWRALAAKTLTLRCSVSTLLVNPFLSTSAEVQCALTTS